jgi:2-dehydropantoate 2-reductase
MVLCQAAAMEGMAVAHAKGVSLPVTLLDQLQPGLQRLPPDAKSSMLQDLERGRPLELAWLSGAIVRIGEELDVHTPTHRFFTTVLAPHAGGQR